MNVERLLYYLFVLVIVVIVVVALIKVAEIAFDEDSTLDMIHFALRGSK